MIAEKATATQNNPSPVPATDFWWDCLVNHTVLLTLPPPPTHTHIEIEIAMFNLTGKI